MGDKNCIKSDVYCNVLKQDIIKCDVAIKGYLQSLRDNCWTEGELQEVAGVVRNKLNQERSLLAKLRAVAQEEDNRELREAAIEEVNKHDMSLQSTHTSFRNALLKSQLAIGERKKQELFGSSSSSENNFNNEVRQRMNKNMALKQSSRLTDDLLTATRMIQENTDKSTKTLDKLVESSQAIGTTQEELKTMGSVISQAKKILGKYGRRENTDKLLIFLGLVFFAACCLVVVRNRLNIF